jgi:hypothetical protein
LKYGSQRTITLPRRLIDATADLPKQMKTPTMANAVSAAPRAAPVEA